MTFERFRPRYIVQCSRDDEDWVVRDTKKDSKLVSKHGDDLKAAWNDAEKRNRRWNKMVEEAMASSKRKR